MNEKAIAERAQRYIELLAEGINPLTGEVLPDSDIVNDVKISRCLYYTSQALGRYIEMIGRRSRTKLEKFHASPLDFQDFKYRDNEVFVSELATMINNHIGNSNMKKLTATTITKWLMSNGYLMEYTRTDGRKSKKPTLLGEQLGIRIEAREGKYGLYFINIYDKNAQKFILDNIDKISKGL